MNATPSVIAAEADEVFHGGCVQQPSAGDISPEQKLFQALLIQTWQDAFENSDWVLCNGKTKGPAERQAMGERRRNEARRWLTISWGRCQEDRELICDMAGVDSDLVRRLALAKLKKVKAQSEKPAETESTVDHAALAKRTRNDLDKLLNQLLGRTDDLDESDVEHELSELAEMESSSLASTA
ncbi:MAG: hypothetical protein GEU87_02400 [Alphaproteobacteria bacterium]|nr:hypothetical protein [Alphaproteobacteria bacterium]